MTVRTGLNILYRTEKRLLCKYNLTFSAAFCTGHLTGSGLTAGSLAFRAFILKCKLYLFFTAEHSLFKGDPYCCPKVRSLSGSRSVRSAPASKEVSEYITKHIREIHGAEISESAIASRSSGSVKGCMAKLIVLSAFIRVRQDGICLGGLFKLGFCRLISGVGIRMVLLCQLPVCFF